MREDRMRGGFGCRSGGGGQDFGRRNGWVAVMISDAGWVGD